MLTTAATKRHISLCRYVHHIILAVNLFDRQYNKNSHELLLKKNT